MISMKIKVLVVITKQTTLKNCMELKMSTQENLELKLKNLNQLKAEVYCSVSMNLIKKDVYLDSLEQ